MGRFVSAVMRFAFATLLAAFLVGAGSSFMGNTNEAFAQNATNVEGNDAVTSGFWAEIRKGASGNVSIPDKQAGQLIQSEGDNWRAVRNGPISVYGAQALFGILLLLAVFFVLRGRIKIGHGRAGTTIERFNTVERMGHWLLAVSFIILAITGLNMLFGRHVLLPVIGKEAFATITQLGKYAHAYLAFAFMLGLVMIIVMWIKHNLPSRTDIRWFMEGGGIIGKKHPPAKKFNGGQKIIFWLVVLGGFSISLSGISLLFPFETAFFAKTFTFLNTFGFNLPTDLSLLQETQLAALWHSIMALFLIAVIIAHIYIGSVGMEGAFDAMGTGQVDLNWAKEHHSLWVDEVQAKSSSGDAAKQPAE